MNADEQKKLDDLSFGLQPDADDSAARAINPHTQGISNRPGDADPDSGVDREPGEDQAPPLKDR